MTNAAATNALQNLRLSWQRLSRASQTSVVAGVFLGFCVAWFWGAGSEERAAKWNGPQKAQRFLRKRKVSYRIGGLSLMLLAYAATLLAGAILFGETLALPFFSTVSVAWFSPSVAFIACVLLDAIYLQGRQLWRRLP